MTGMAPVSATDSLITDSKESIQFDMTKLRESAAYYIRMTTKHGNYMQKVKALIFNKRGRVLKELNKGDFVTFYVPRSHEETRAKENKG